MKTTYNACLKLIKLGRTDGLKEKIANLYAMDCLTEEEFNDLMERLGDKE